VIRDHTSNDSNIFLKVSSQFLTAIGSYKIHFPDSLAGRAPDGFVSAMRQTWGRIEFQTNTATEESHFLGVGEEYGSREHNVVSAAAFQPQII
jgi:hypothetical protein